MRGIGEYLIGVPNTFLGGDWREFLRLLATERLQRRQEQSRHRSEQSSTIATSSATEVAIPIDSFSPVFWVQMAMAKFSVVRQLLSLATNVPSSPGTSMHGAKEKIMGVMSTPVDSSRTFHAQAAEGVEGDEVDGALAEDTVAARSSGTDLAQITEGMPKCMSAFAELLYNLYLGHRLRLEIRASRAVGDLRTVEMVRSRSREFPFAIRRG